MRRVRPRRVELVARGEGKEAGSDPASRVTPSWYVHQGVLDSTCDIEDPSAPPENLESFAAT